MCACVCCVCVCSMGACMYMYEHVCSDVHVTYTFPNDVEYFQKYRILVISHVINQPITITIYRYVLPIMSTRISHVTLLVIKCYGHSQSVVLAKPYKINFRQPHICTVCSSCSIMIQET